ncbi:MAG: acyloxyacyl hydrolase [Candidatus Thiodiazotropha sp. (ex Epidulcina cf. delphinae)]|nr:acyloxyacyl hydrolase [Candidatus Thiodiazotropha sp. (ex Epidulcina cf. delphinae)]
MITGRCLPLSLCLLPLLTQSPQAMAEKRVNSWHLLAGFGESHPSWGKTQQRVKTRDLILRHERPQGQVHGKGWYLNRRSMLIEIPLHWLQSHDQPPIFGVTFNACWTLPADQRLQPYLFVGGGPAYTRAEIPGTSSKLKGVYQAGGGLRLNLEQTRLDFEFRFHHISNGGHEEPNDPLNSGKFLIGIRLGI